MIYCYSRIVRAVWLRAGVECTTRAGHGARANQSVVELIS